MSGHRGPLLAVTDGRHLRLGDPLQEERAAHGLCAPLAEANVVFARATLIRMPLEAYFDTGIAGNDPGVRRNDIDEFRLDVAAVKVKVDDLGLRRSGARYAAGSAQCAAAASRTTSSGES